MSDPFEPALLTVLYWFFVGTIVVCGFTAWRMLRWTRIGPSRPNSL